MSLERLPNVMLFETTASLPVNEPNERYVACSHCETPVDCAETHPVVHRAERADLEAGVSVLHHFCSDSCRTQWREIRQNDG
jgi:hypothetical protein